MARRALVVCGLAAAQIGAPREYYVGEGADRVHFEVGWTDDVRAAVARACGEVYAGRTIQECVDLMVDRVERDRTLTMTSWWTARAYGAWTSRPPTIRARGLPSRAMGLNTRAGTIARGASSSASPETAAAPRTHRRPREARSVRCSQPRRRSTRAQPLRLRALHPVPQITHDSIIVVPSAVSAASMKEARASHRLDLGGTSRRLRPAPSTRPPCSKVRT